MNTATLDNSTLDSLRKEQDSLADEVIQSMELADVRSLMPYLTDFKGLKKIPAEFKAVNNFIANNSALPEWMDFKQIVRACDFYYKYAMPINMSLSCYALPYCYLGANGAQVLVMTERIKKNTYNRLKETGYFLQSVLNIDNWKNGKVQQSFLKTRLLHASVRYFIKHHGKWDKKYGMPINQEDMAGTNLAFSLIVIRGLRKTGHMIDLSEEKAYLHLWKVGAYFLGINESLWIDTIKEALLLDKAIAQRQFASSKEGVELTTALLDCYLSFTSNSFESNMIIAQTRFMLGDDYADMLQVPKTKVPRALLKTYNYSSAFLTSMFK